MKKMRKLFVVMLVILCVLGLAACDNGNVTTAATTTDTPESTTISIPEPTTTGPQTEHEHTFGAWKTVTNATCTVDGLEERVCDCGEKETRNISATGHGQTEVKGTKAATCTEEGYTGDTYCTVCNEKIADGAVVKTIDHEYHEENFYLSTYGACGGTLTVESCEKCGLARDMEISGIDSCDWEEKEYKETDKEIRQVMECPGCGARYEAAAELTPMEGCAIRWQGYFRLTIGEKELYYDVDMTMNDHKTVLFEEELNKHGFCRGYYCYYKCLACETIPYSYVSTRCNWVEQEEKVDDFTVYQCSYCNAYRYYRKQTEEKDSCCVSYTTTNIYQQGEYKITVENSGRYYEHDYEYEYVRTGEDCTDPWTCTATCKNCGSSYVEKGEGHDWHDHSEDLGAQGLCDGKFWYYECNICGQISYTLYDGDCVWEEQEVNADGFTVYHCAQCDACWYLKSVEDQAGCVYSDSGTSRLQLGDYTFELEYSITYDYHVYEYQYTLNGETCADGWSCVTTCANCDFRKETSGKGHVREYRSEDLSEHGFCDGGYYQYDECAVCGEITDPYMDTWCRWEEQGENEDGFTVCRCSRCGAYWYCKSTEEKDGCCVSYTTTNIYQQGEYKITIEDSGEYYQHDYVYTYKRYGETCADGWICTVTCKNCDYKDEDTDIGHDLEYKTEDLSEHGICGGYYNYGQCTICGQIAEGEFTGLDCNWEEQGVNAEGFTVLHCSVCGAYAYTKDAKETDGCHYKYTYTAILQKDDYKATMENTEEGYDHDYEYEYVLKGETCADGWTCTVTCKNCNYRSVSNSGWGHRTDWFEEDFGAHGLCGGWYQYYKCAICGEITHSDIYIECNMEYQQTNEEGFEIYQCSVCGAYMYYKETEIREDCYYKYIYDVTYEKGEYSYTIKDIYDGYNHSYEYAYELNGETCADGWTCIVTCKNCEYRDEYSGEGHDTQDFREDLHEHGFCGGYYGYEKCAICGEITWYSVYISCYWEEQGENEDGFTVYHCSDCGAYQYYKRTEDRDGCYVEYSYTEIFRLGEYELTLEGSDEYYDHDYEYEYVLNGDSCDDGWTCTVTCKKCGESWTYSGEGHVEVWFAEDTSDHGFCSGTYYGRKCELCDEILSVSSYTYTNCGNWQYQGETEDGFSIHRCSHCGAYRYSKEMDVQWDGCDYTYILIVTYEQGAFRFTVEYEGHGERHNFVYTCTPVNGVDGAEGWAYTVTCSACGDSYEYESSMLQTNAVIVMPDGTKYQPINLSEQKITISDLTKGEDGNYYYDDCAVYIAVNNWNYYWLSGYSLSECVEVYGDEYLDTTYWEDLSAATGTSGYAVLNDDTLLWLTTLITGNPVWGETEEDLPAYLYCYITA